MMTPAPPPTMADIARLLTQVTPHKYDGKLAQDGLHFVAQARIYHTTLSITVPGLQAMIVWSTILNKLIDRAADWAGPHMIMLASGKTPWVDLDVFKTAFKAHFCAADNKEAAVTELVKLCKAYHKVGTVKEYTADFNVIAARTSFSDEDKHEWYCTGLPLKIKNVLATSAHDISNLAKIQKVALSLDQVLLTQEEEWPKSFGWKKKGEKAAATGKKPFTGNCFVCSKPGHHKFECSQFKDQQVTSSSTRTTEMVALQAQIKAMEEKIVALTVAEKKEGF